MKAGVGAGRACAPAEHEEACERGNYVVRHEVREQAAAASHGGASVRGARLGEREREREESRAEKEEEAWWCSTLAKATHERTDDCVAPSAVSAARCAVAISAAVGFAVSAATLCNTQRHELTEGGREGGREARVWRGKFCGVAWRVAWRVVSGAWSAAYDAAVAPVDGAHGAVQHAIGRVDASQLERLQLRCGGSGSGGAGRRGGLAGQRAMGGWEGRPTRMGAKDGGAGRGWGG